ncbi:MAG: hypothetical protein HOU01_17020 [Streptomycetaceae bacterium]|jgi:hypothetical protein|nr:hypothetical protein [Streptomycetaceae bacterium]
MRFRIPTEPVGQRLSVRQLTAVHVTQCGVDFDGPVYPPGVTVELPEGALVMITRIGTGELGLDTVGVLLATADPDTGRLRQLHDEYPAESVDAVVRYLIPDLLAHLERRAPAHR